MFFPILTNVKLNQMSVEQLSFTLKSEIIISVKRETLCIS